MSGQQTIGECAPGAALGHYRILEKIGAGGMGEVFRARDEHLDREVAIKVLPPGTLGDESARKRFHKEALALSKLNHPNIATIHDFDTQTGRDFLVMEYIPGATLSERLRAGPLAEKEIVRLGLQLAEGLEAAHAHGIVHRDLKPGNVRITPDGRLKILDFGLAKLLTPMSDTAVTASLSETPTFAGTLPYMAPEQLTGDPIDARTDIHAAGTLLYEMATAQHPFAKADGSQLIGAILRQAPVPPGQLNRKLSPELERIIGKCLEKEPENRYQSAKELAVDVRRLLTPSTVAHPTPRRRFGAGKRIWLAAALMVGAVLVGAGYFFVHRSSARLTDKDTVVLAEFVNTTGDPIFDGTLRQGLSSQLEQSPFLKLLSDERVGETLSLMAQSKEAQLTPPLAREVCQRTASTATIEGSISSLGSQYVLGLKAVNCANGDLLAQQQVTADRKEEVLKALGEAATKMREKLGESLASVQKYDGPVDRVTTSSLEALKACSLGYKAHLRGDFVAASTFYQRAIALDPNFAWAYGRLGSAYGNLGEFERQAENMRKAYELRDHVSEAERLFITARYEYAVVGDLEAARKIYELWNETYPRDPPINLSAICAALGDYEKAVALAEEALRREPSGVTYGNLVGNYVMVTRLVQAKATAKEAQTRQFDSANNHLWLYLVAFLEHDRAGMEREAAALMGKPGYENAMLYLESDTAAFVGQFANARELTGRAIGSAGRVGNKETVAIYQAQSALREALVGNVVVSTRQAKAALALSNGRVVEVFSALALGLAGNIAEATRLAADLGRRFPKNTRIQWFWLPMIDAVVAIQTGTTKGGEKAIQVLAAAVPYELGISPESNAPLYPVYIRGLAYLHARQAAPAVSEFRKILDHPSLIGNDIVGALARLQLARAYTISGDTAKARGAYQDFLTFWKDADPDIPILQQAKAECAKLQ